MRGIVLGAQAPVLGRTRAVLLTSLLFALVHGNFSGFLGLLFMSGVLTVLAWRTGSLWPSMLAHLSFNLSSLALSSLARGILQSQQISGELVQISSSQLLFSALLYTAVALPFAALCGLLLWAVWRHTSSADRRVEPMGKAGLRLTWPWWAGTVLLAALVLLNLLQVYGVMAVKA